MPTPNPPELTLAEYIAQFKVDGQYAHLFTTGTETEDVVLADGRTYPTIAKMVAANQLALQESLQDAGFAIRTYNFTNALELHVKHNLQSTKFTESIVSATGQKILASAVVVDDSEFVVTFTEPETGSITVVFSTNT